jgi:uncharacterized membrane protein (DUF4010 family)
VLPSSAVDPWGLLSLKKVATMIFALVFIQVMGSVIGRLVGMKAGAILTGFLGGLISSTATTASLARQSRTSSSSHSPVEIIIFLSATTAMLFEGAAMLLVGTSEIHPSLFVIFSGPVLATLAMIFLQSRKVTEDNLPLQTEDFKILPILKLSAFIVFVLALSKILQNFLGENGIYILTFLVSLFEIHGSVIANIQLHDSGVFDVRALGDLLAISIVASYLSKLLLIFVLSRSELKSQVLNRTAILFVSLGLS